MFQTACDRISKHNALFTYEERKIQTARMISGYQLVSAFESGGELVLYWQRPLDQDPRRICTSSIKELPRNIAAALGERFPRLGDLCAASASDIDRVLRNLASTSVIALQGVEAVTRALDAYGLHIGMESPRAD